MSGPLILVTMFIYFYVAAEQLAKGNLPMFVVWGSYGLANVGFWMSIK